MLEAKDYENLDFASPFPGQVKDACCEVSRAAPITDVFTPSEQFIILRQYDELLKTIRREEFRPGWAEHELLKLRRQIENFEIRTKSISTLVRLKVSTNSFK